jgi:hypothetical protein
VKTLSFKAFVRFFPQERTDFSTGPVKLQALWSLAQAVIFWSRICHYYSTQKTGIMLKQVQTQKQQHTILPQQIELLNLFHLNTLELELRIQDEMSENPALEELSPGDEVLSLNISQYPVMFF